MKNAVFMEHWTKQCKFSFCYAQSLKGVIITLSRFYINVCLFWSNVEYYFSNFGLGLQTLRWNDLIKK